MKLQFSDYTFSAVMDYPPDPVILDLGEGYDPDMISRLEWAVGKYDEQRKQMYLAPQYRGRRNIHMGIDIWSAAGSTVYAFHDGEVAYLADHPEAGNYGPTMVTRHRIGSTELFALHGHLSRALLRDWSEGDRFSSGDRLAVTGTLEENGGWAPHLHFQLSLEDPGEADMPGVVAEEDRMEALGTYPDPRTVLGELYE